MRKGLSPWLSPRTGGLRTLRQWIAAGLACAIAAQPVAATKRAVAEDGAQEGAAQDQRADRAPNVILIMADDVGVDAFDAYGGEYSTPNINRLAAQGVTFDHAFSTPLCSPSRTRLMTGIENARNYEAFAYLEPGQRTFGNVFADAGYATGMVGKWQLSGNGYDGRVGITARQAGFQESLLWHLEAGPQKGSRFWGPTLWKDGDWTINEEGFGPDYLNAYALSFVDRHKDRPFFLYYSMVLVHDPFVGTPDELAPGDEKARFGAMMRYMDRMVGKLLDRLDSHDLTRDTLVIFTADNGTNRRIYSLRNGERVRGGKGQPTLAGTHVPLIMRFPRALPAGVRREGLFDFLDVLPTMADAAGLSAANVPAANVSAVGGIDGVSQLPVAQGKVPAVRETIFQHYAPVWNWPSTRFVFDRTRKLYDSGDYVALDIDKSTETAIEGAALTARERRHKALLQQVLERDKAPLDPARFPWCTGKQPVEAGKDPVVVGCGEKPGGRPD